MAINATAKVVFFITISFQVKKPKPERYFVVPTREHFFCECIVCGFWRDVMTAQEEIEQHAIQFASVRIDASQPHDKAGKTRRRWLRSGTSLSL